MTQQEITTIRVAKSTRELLKDLGRKGESYDDIIVKEILGKAAGGMPEGYVSMPVSREFYDFCFSLAEALSPDEPLEIVDVGDAIGASFVRLGGALGYWYLPQHSRLMPNSAAVVGGVAAWFWWLAWDNWLREWA